MLITQCDTVIPVPHDKSDRCEVFDRTPYRAAPVAPLAARLATRLSRRSAPARQRRSRRFETLSIFKRWADAHFGSAHLAGKALDVDGGGTLSFSELKLALTRCAPWRYGVPGITHDWGSVLYQWCDTVAFFFVLWWHRSSS